MKLFKSFVVASFLLGSMTMGGCLCLDLGDLTKPNEAATKICKPKANTSDDCEKCCTENNANGNTYGGSGTCNCLGG